MDNHQLWKNFDLGQELSVAGAFIYNGLRRFHEMQVLDNVDELFEFFYNLSVGLERLLKICVVLLEHKPENDQIAFEKSLITHNHSELLRRVKKHVKLNLGSPHNDFLALLDTFYTKMRYDRFTLASYYSDKEREHLLGFLNKHLHAGLDHSSDLLVTVNDKSYGRFISNVVKKLSKELFAVIETKARELNLYTYELRDGSRAQTIFLGDADLREEEVLWKELLLFFMNTKSPSKVIEFMRSIEPLEFDPGLSNEYLECFRSNLEKALVLDELDVLYDELESPKERLELIDFIGRVEFDNEPTDGNDSFEESDD